MKAAGSVLVEAQCSVRAWSNPVRWAVPPGIVTSICIKCRVIKRNNTSRKRHLTNCFKQVSFGLIVMLCQY